MASITFTVPILKSYRDKKAIGVPEYLLYLLLGNRPAGTNTQTINADTYYSSYGIDNQSFATALQSLARLKFLTYGIQQVTITWSSPTVTADMNETTLRSRWGKSLDDKTYYLSQILLNSKTSGVAVQSINPDSIASSWTITTGEIMSELATLLSRKEITTIDLGNVTVTWLVTDAGFTRTEEQTMSAIAKGLGSAQHNSLMALLHAKGSAALQTVNADTIATNWKIDNTKLFSDLQTLKKAEIINEANSALTLVFPSAVTTTMSETELKSEMKNLTANDYVHLALKREYTDAAPANRTLVISPAEFETEWGVKADELYSAAKTLSSGTSKKFDIDLASVDITWLVAPASSKAAISPTNLSINANTAFTITLDASVTGAITFQWYKDGAAASGIANGDASNFPLNLTAQSLSTANFGPSGGPGQWFLRFTQGTTTFDTNTVTVGN